MEFDLTQCDLEAGTATFTSKPVTRDEAVLWLQRRYNEYLETLAGAITDFRVQNDDRYCDTKGWYRTR